MRVDKPIGAAAAGDGTGPTAASHVGAARLDAGVRHSLRSQIGQVIGYSELWLDEIREGGAIDPEALLRDLARIREAGNEILAIVNRHVDPVGERAARDGE
jgi:hypothetical protein